MRNNYILQTTDLSYNYSKNVQTLFDINLQVEKGSIYGFIGPNGSGKTTTLSLLLGLRNLQKGSIALFGKELKDDRINILKKVGTLIESPSFYGHLTARENLNVYRDVYGVDKNRVEEVLTLVDLSDTGRKKARHFSLGMKQRLAIALALLPNPELLILDEPTNGLDPNGIIELRGLIKKLNQELGITIIISSHILAEVEKMVTHIGIIFKGKMLFQGTLQELHGFQQKKAKLNLHTSDNPEAIKILHEYSPELSDEIFSLSYNSLQQIAEINRKLMKNNIDVYLLQPKGNNLEELFIDMTTNLS
ncbi:ABC transporter ATP-binding protein [Emticicia agri]|uniref:ATP-binding cassette domain-containing protein n=1 Tax=Emticicia agri TaxID=2492393 RepID=A0A4Q5LXI4_9BACT|nr:ATP-binding cassette domain-containing protein [Emticicia agri]RYU94464.1 ATP-binding cassette domain-containing protein [Emticicia agri]